jgi:two-component system, response regulator PdtaR
MENNQSNHTAPKRTVLIVEDDVFQAFVLEKMLISINYAIAGTAASGEDAIQLARHLEPDIIIMDIMLSGNLNGIEAASIILENYMVPIIYVTGNADKYYLNRAKKTGYSAYLLKPVTMYTLKNALRSAE